MHQCEDDEYLPDEDIEYIPEYAWTVKRKVITD